MENGLRSNEINFNEIMAYQWVNHLSVPDELTSSILGILTLEEKYLFLDDLLVKRKCADKEELLSTYPRYFMTGIAIKRGDKFEPIVYDLWSDHDVHPGDYQYEYFFAFRLSQKSVFEVYPFLEYHLEKFYEGNFERFTTFLRQSIRVFSETVIQLKTIETIEDWINEKIETSTPLNGIFDRQSYSQIRWTGNKVDFIKLVYALYETGMLNEGKGSKTKLAENLAAVLEVTYNSKDNDLSKSIGEAEKHGYDIRKFFDDLKSGFENYLQTLQKRNNS